MFKEEVVIQINGNKQTTSRENAWELSVKVLGVVLEPEEQKRFDDFREENYELYLEKQWKFEDREYIGLCSRILNWQGGMSYDDFKQINQHSKQIQDLVETHAIDSLPLNVLKEYNPQNEKEEQMSQILRKIDKK